MEFKFIEITPRSHMDHGVSEEALALLDAAVGRNEGTKSGPIRLVHITLPAHLAGMSALRGPLAGDPPIKAGDPRVRFEVRGGRPWASKLVDLPHKPCAGLVGVFGEFGGPAKLFTAYYGPAISPREPGDPSLWGAPADAILEANRFWDEHALSSQV